MSVANPQELEELNATLSDFGYQALAICGKGGYATCWIVKRFNLEDQYFVCKEFKLPENIMKEVLTTSFHAEVDALIHLTHTNIVQCYDYFTKGNCLYLILEYCNGGSLMEMLENGQTISTEQIIYFAKNILSALQYLKAMNICHLDIKPSNILLDKFGRIKLADFGLSCHVHEKINRYIGSFVYMAPEIISKTPYDPFEADMWSFGITIYQLATGKLPWPKATRAELESIIKFGIYTFPAGTNPIIMELVKRTVIVEPRKRATAEQLLAFLNQTTKSEKPLTPLKSIRRYDSQQTITGTPLLQCMNTMSSPKLNCTSRRRRRIGSTASLLLSHSSPLKSSLPRLTTPVL